MLARSAKIRSGFLILTACILLWPAASAQSNKPTDPSAPATPAAESTRSTPVDPDALELRRQTIEQNSGLDEAAKTAQLAKIGEIIELAKKAAKYRNRNQQYTEAVTTAPEETKQLIAAQQNLKTQPDTRTGLSADELTAELETRRANLLELRANLKSEEAKSTRLKERPVAISARLPDARNELAKAKTELAAARDANAGASDDLDILLPVARVQALEAEIDMLAQERLSLNVRDELTTAKIALLERQIATTETDVTGLQKTLEKQVRQEADVLAEKVVNLTAAPGAENDGEDYSAIEAELNDLSTELQKSATQLNQLGTRHERILAQNKELEYQHQRLAEQLALGAYAGSFSQVILEQRRSLPDPQAFAHSIRTRTKDLQKLRLAAFQNEGRLREQRKLEHPDNGEATGKMHQYLKVRRELVEKISANYDSLVSELARIDAEERSLRNNIIRFRKLLSREIFWRRSSPTIGIDTFRDTPAAVLWFVSAENWTSGFKTLGTAIARRPVVSSSVALLTLALLAARKRLKNELVQTGTRTRMISSDRYKHTLAALGLTILIALPWVILLGYLSYILEREPANTDWIRGISRGLEWVGIIVASATMLMETCRNGGLGIAHFGWTQTEALCFRRMVRTILLTQTPFLIPLSSTLYEDNFRHFDSMGRLSLTIALVISASILAKYLHPKTGVLASAIERNPDNALSRLSPIWYPLVVLSPIALAILSSAGWALTAMALAFVFDATLATASVGLITYHMILRWFMIKERRLALENALKERRARRTAAEGTDESSDETITAETEKELNLDDVGEQTRRLLRSLTTIGVISLVWMIWTGTLPLEEVLGSAEIFSVSLLSIAQGIMLVAIFTTFSRNLPGLLELSGLRAVVPDSGTRYAITTIGQYTIIATGLVLLSMIFQIDWSKLGWIAAALSVGLGFGLQEVVANFVCGIILLFERPIRVGDVVTIDGIDGTVTRIQMRATTITNWDRKEFIVPNKQFITGTLMNWTLSNHINRVVIPVGVAYGTDTRRARQLLLDIASSHPNVLENPAPFASFEQFGDSTLNLNLRVYLPTMENRLATITELHSVIDERFKEAAIEIAFPQQDIHIRTINGKLPDA
ncbi:MAG: mechanosensitive ion channel domain-containing protein [Verrucomicrobiota bacterium JB025]|nr:mechanosensitive ion channel [Verrucomicrobiota bacterium JB025]